MTINVTVVACFADDFRTELVELAAPPMSDSWLWLPRQQRWVKTVGNPIYRGSIHVFVWAVVALPSDAEWLDAMTGRAEAR